MIDDKRMGEYCEFAKRYVPIVVKYHPDGSSSKFCESSACGNSDCSMSDSYRGNEDRAKSALGEPEHDIE